MAERADPDSLLPGTLMEALDMRVTDDRQRLTCVSRVTLAVRPAAP